MARRSRQQVDAEARRILVRLRREALAENERAIAGLDEVYAAIAQQVRREIGGVASAATIERIARERLEDALRDVMPIVERGVLSAAVAGARAPTETFRATFPGARAPRVAEALEAQRAAAQVMRGRIAARDVPLSARVRANHQDIARRMGREIQASMRGGESAFETMERVLEVNSGGQPAPVAQYVERLRGAAQLGGPALQRELRDARAIVRRLGSVDRGNTSMRAAGETMLRRIETAREEDIDAIVERWAHDKAQYQAKVIARTEAIAAHRQAYETQMRSREWTKGFRWQLSPAHKVPDICDLLANQNLHGLGPGGYPPDAVPDTPHPSCTCTQVAIIDEAHFDREIARELGEEPPPESWIVGGEQSAAEWLAQQPEEFQLRVLGPTRAEVFRSQPAVVLAPTGAIRSVRDVMQADQRASRAR